MMSTLIIPDLHGKIKVAEWALEQDQYNIVFLGDYLDSFSEPRKKQRKLLEMVLTAAEDNPDRVTALLGNHEMSYLKPTTMRASGFSSGFYSKLKYDQVLTRANNILQPYKWVGKFLLSHAGVSQKLLTFTEETVQEYLEAGAFEDIGRARGGPSPIGGLYWCDWWEEFTPVDGIPQIVGHSSARGISKKNKRKIVDKIDNYGNLSYNTDGLDRPGKKHFLVIHDDNTVEKLKVMI